MVRFMGPGFGTLVRPLRAHSEPPARESGATSTSRRPETSASTAKTRPGRQRSKHLRFPCESRHALHVRREGCRQNSDRHLRAQPGVRGAIHFAHAAFAQLSGEAIMRYCLTNQSSIDYLCKDGMSPHHAKQVTNVRKREIPATLSARWGPLSTHAPAGDRGGAQH